MINAFKVCSLFVVRWCLVGGGRGFPRAKEFKEMMDNDSNKVCFLTNQNRLLEGLGEHSSNLLITVLALSPQ